MQGSVDRISPDGAVGWLFGANLTEPPVVSAFLQQRLIGQAVANLHRADLEAVGFGDGRCGFEIAFQEQIDPALLPFVAVRPDGYQLNIPTTDNAAVVDLIQAVAGGYQSAGRNRSVLGGLWTDRTDAPRVLAGRIAVGATTPDLQPLLQELILNGFAVLQGVLAPRGLTSEQLDLVQLVAETSRGSDRGVAEIKSALAALGSFTFRDPVVKLLRAVFDDHPIAYRLDVLREPDAAFAQVCAIEAFPSPAEAVAVYVGGPQAAARLEVVRDSHELPEFSQTRGASRWTANGAADLPALAAQAGCSVDDWQLDAMDMVVIGPGLIHRVLAGPEAPVLRILLAPRRITPLRFLSGDGGWIEVGHVSGARIRV